MKYNGMDGYKLSTGKLIYAHYGVIGIDLSSDDMSIHDGYDGIIDVNDKEEKTNNLTVAETKEIALCMIEKWKKIGNI